MTSIHQENIEQYHNDIESMHHGHNMHIVHRDWHASNPDPRMPPRQDPSWDVDMIFGTNFLQMHHEMVKATDAEPHLHMMHPSVAQWYKSEDITLPDVWDPLSEIPSELIYDPDPDVFPDEIRGPIEQFAASQGQTMKEFLTRTTDAPRFDLPKYFTVEGISDPEDADPLTGAMKLSDFVNRNQLGCSLVFPHNLWHVAIGGAMSTTWTAIADPIFYLGVHWHLDHVFDEFKLIETERSVRSMDRRELESRDLLSGVEKQRGPRKFTTEENKKIRDFADASRRVRAPFEFMH